MLNISRVGVDLAKNVFQLHGVDNKGRAVWKRRLSRDKWLKVLFETVKPGAAIGMEACTGAHHWSRILQKSGYKVIIIPSQFVKPFVKSNKNDANDAQAICEAMIRPNMYPVPVKTVEQQDLQAIHRIRDEIKAHRVAKGNQIRGLVSEYGLVAPRELSSLRQAIPVWLEDSSEALTSSFKQLLRSLWDDLRYLDERMDELNHQIKDLSKQDSTAKRLLQIPGIGPLIATALIATIGTGKQYKKGRNMAAALGLTPRQHSSGGKDKLLGITKRGDSYLRCLLIHGARSVIRTSKGKTDHLSRWIDELQKRRHSNVIAVAVANKLARIAWAVMSKELAYDPDYKAVSFS